MTVVGFTVRSPLRYCFIPGRRNSVLLYCTIIDLDHGGGMLFPADGWPPFSTGTEQPLSAANSPANGLWRRHCLAALPQTGWLSGTPSVGQVTLSRPRPASPQVHLPKGSSQGVSSGGQQGRSRQVQCIAAHLNPPDPSCVICPRVAEGQIRRRRSMRADVATAKNKRAGPQRCVGL